MDTSHPSDEQRSPMNPMQPVTEFLQGGDPDAICLRHGITRSELEKRIQLYQDSMRQAALEGNFATHKAVGRNEPCPCGSGKKYKKCCLSKDEEARTSIPPDVLRQMEEQAKQREKLEREVAKGLDLLFTGDFSKAQHLAERLIESFPQDDRLHDILATVALAAGEYDEASGICRRRWQIATEEKTFYQENGYHQREGAERKNPVHFYTPSTWLDKLWIAQRARSYTREFPDQGDPGLNKLVAELKTANDMKRFAGKQEEGLETRRQVLAPVLEGLEAAGPSAIPYILPLTYSISWATLFVPDLLAAYGTDTSIRLLAELSMFRFPYFAQKCLANLEPFGDRSVAQIRDIIEKDQAFDELKVGLIEVLGNIRTPESFALLVQLAEHENPYVVNWVGQALGKQQNPEALPYLEKIKERLDSLNKVASAIQDLAPQM